MDDEMRNDQENPRPDGTQDSGQAPARYTHYEVKQRAVPVKRSSRPPYSSGKKRRKSFGDRFAGTVVLAVVFGLVAGCVFQGVNIVSEKYLSSADETPIGTTELIADTDTDSQQESVQNVIAGSGTVAGVAEATMPSVVAITSVSIQEIPDYFGYYFGYGAREYPSTGSGSGIIVGENDDELLIATNNHVVEGATTLNVCFIGDDVVKAGEETQSQAGNGGDINVEDAVSAKIKGTDAENDLAVVAVNKEDIPEDTIQQIKIAQLGNSDNLALGEQVVAIGNALGFGQSVTSGWVSALNRTVTLEDGTRSELIQTDAAINPGNSGGALLNMRGEVIGINSAKYADDAVEGIGYAIPISKAQPILEDLMNLRTRDKVEESKASFLGVEILDLTTEAIEMYNMPTGAFVYEVTAGEAAEAGGIRKGDIIVKLDGQKITDKENLVERLQYYEAGEVVEIVVARANDGEYVEQTLEVTLGSRASADN